MTSRLVALAETVHQIRLLHAKALGIISDMHRANDATTLGYSTLPALLMDTVRFSQRTAARVVKQAEQITETLTPTGHTTPAPLPTAREAVLEGVLDGEHLDVIADVVKALPTTASIADRELVESLLTKEARATNPT